MAKPFRTRVFSLFCSLVLLALGTAGCGSGGGGSADASTDTGSSPDVGPEDQGPPVDLGPRDMGVVSCDGVVCEQPFFRCVNGACVEYPRCFTSATCPEGSVCTGLHCVPGDIDIDGDTYPASTDCNEADATVNPGATEVCSLVDENCVDGNDEGDAQTLCATDPAGDVCMSSVCCPFNYYNYDGDRGNGCECAASPTPGLGASCGAPISAGTVSDAGSGETIYVSDNALPAGREVWYRFTATDSPDATCDNFSVRVRFTQNPGNRYRLNVYRGCATALCDASMGYTDTTWALDSQAPGTPPRGQCPCASDSTTTNACLNDTQDFLVRVTWADTSAPDCDPYEIEISNNI